MPSVTVLVADRMVVVDGKAATVKNGVWDDSIHAIQWSGSSGEIEFVDGPPQAASIADVQPYIDAFNVQVDADYEARKSEGLSLDANEVARDERDSLLADTDWWVLSDVGATDAQLAYRAALRDLPSTSNWSPVMLWVDDDPDRDMHHCVLSGVNWPAKP